MNRRGIMKTTIGNGFDLALEGDVICITTNGEVRNDGRAVMGAGIAKFARDTFPGTDKRLAQLLHAHGNRAFRLSNEIYKRKKVTLATYPTKHKWRDSSHLDLIQTSAQQLVEMANKFGWTQIWIPAPGCSHGNLSWSDVKNVIEPILDDRFIIFSLDRDTFSH